MPFHSNKCEFRKEEPSRQKLRRKEDRRENQAENQGQSRRSNSKKKKKKKNHEIFPIGKSISEEKDYSVAASRIRWAQPTNGYKDASSVR